MEEENRRDPKGEDKMIVEEILEKLKKVEKTKTGWQSLCPAHDDHNPSLSIRESDGKILVNCFAGCSTEDICHAIGKEMKDLFLDAPENTKSSNAIKKMKPKSRPKKQKPKFKSLKDAIDNCRNMNWAKEVQNWVYTDEEGNEVMAEIRIDKNDGKKTYWPMREVGDGWEFGDPEGPLPLYNIPEVLRAIGEGRCILIVEGPKCVEAARELGFPATTSSHGADAAKKTDLSLLKGANVVILADNDESGERYKDCLLQELQSLPADNIKVVTLPDLEENGDIVDFIKKRRSEGLADDHIKDEITNLIISQPSEPRSDLPLTDYGNAERLCLQWGHNIRYCAERGHWYFWDFKRWAYDSMFRVMQYAKKTVRQIHAQADAISVAELQSKNERDAAERCRERLSRHALRSEHRQRLKAMIEVAKSEAQVSIESDSLDNNKWLINLNNGTYDLEKRYFYPHRRGDFITKIAPVDYDPEAQCPNWIEFLRYVLDERDEIVDFIRRAVGYSLTGDTSEQCLFFLYGTGSNGKSTFTETLEAIIGKYCQRVPTTAIMQKPNGAIPNDIARLPGIRMAFTSEIEEGKRLAESVVKDLTGNDTITARFMKKEFFEFKPTHKLWMYGNHKPMVRGTDIAIWRRIHLVPFTRTIPAEKRIRGMQRILKSEGSGILNWAIEGCREWKDEGLNPPDAVKSATQGYRKEMDRIGRFLDECCVTGGESRISSKALYKKYESYCEEVGEKAMSKHNFGRKIGERGFENFRTSSERGWKGLTLANEQYDGE